MTLEAILTHAVKHAVKILAGNSGEYLPNNAIPLEDTLLSGDEVLQNVYEHLKEKHPSVEISFAATDTGERAARMPRKLVATDTNHFPHRRGYLSYPSAAVLQLPEQQWVLARGIKTGDYNKSPCRSDIVAFPSSRSFSLDEEVTANSLRFLRRELYEHCPPAAPLLYSLLVAKRDGSLRLRADVEKGTGGLNRFVHKRDIYGKNGQGRIASRYEYDAEAVPAIVECVERVLWKSQ